MGCNCGPKPKVVYVWTSEDGTRSMTYSREALAHAKVIRERRDKGGSGGSYLPKPA